MFIGGLAYDAGIIIHRRNFIENWKAMISKRKQKRRMKSKRN